MHADAIAAQAAAPAAASSTGTTPAAAAPLSSDSLGSGFFSRFFNYQALEWGKSSSPLTDPNAPPSRRDGWSPQPENAPPMPFTEWSYGGTTSIGVNRPSSVDSPLMVALAPSKVGNFLTKSHIQVYGWVDVGGNESSSHVRGGNAPAAYDYNPNRIQLDQAVLYVERTPDTVQTDHLDWGFRLAGIYGSDYRYTTSYGLWSSQLLKHNKQFGYDIPMAYAELYIPQVAQGLILRVGRFISLPDIEAQLAPNNYMYSHSIAYTFDNYTNTGIQGTLAVNKNWFLQLGVALGSDSAFWNRNSRVANPYPNPLYPGNTFPKDPGSRPSLTACARYQTDSANNALYLCADAINNGVWGYNNLQWYGATFYHRFNDKWHISLEAYDLHQNDVPNLNNPIAKAALANGGTPFSTPDFRFNSPGAAYCDSATVIRCRASALAGLGYLNYQFSPLDNLSFRGEFYDDKQGQRTGTPTRYLDFAVGVQHWFSPQFEIRPELAYYRSLDLPAFDGNANRGIAPTKDHEIILSGDVIMHF